MITEQKFLLKFDTDSEIQASTLAAELEKMLRAEMVTVERHRENPNSMNLGELIAFEIPLILAAHVIAHLIAEFIARWKSEVIIVRPDGTELRTRMISPKQLAQALEEFLGRTTITGLPNEDEHGNKNQ